MFNNAVDRLNATGAYLNGENLTAVLTILNNDFPSACNATVGGRVSFLMKKVDVFQQPIAPNHHIVQLVGELLQNSIAIGNRCQATGNNNLSKDLLRVLDALAERIYEIDPLANFDRLIKISNAI